MNKYNDIENNPNDESQYIGGIRIEHEEMENNNLTGAKDSSFINLAQGENNSNLEKFTRDFEDIGIL